MAQQVIDSIRRLLRLLQANRDRRDVAQLTCPALRAESLDREADERVLGVSAVAAMDLF